MPTITAGMGLPQSYRTVTAQPVTTVPPQTAARDEQTTIDGQGKLKASSQRRSLQQEYDTKKEELVQKRNTEEQKVESEYKQERRRLDQEYKQKQRDMGISVYV
jgi:predicted RNA-binding protein with PIN domain